MSRRLCFLLCVILLQSSCGSPRSEGPSSDKTTPQKAGPTQAEAQVAELQGKITKWQTNRDKLTKLLEQLQKDKTSTVQKLVELGVKSENDLANNPKGQVLHGELKDIVKQVALYDKKFQDYDLAIFKSESRVRSIARQLSAKEAGVSDTELEELTRSMVTLDESLSSEKEPAVPIDLKDTLKEEVASYQAHQQAALEKAEREKTAVEAKAAQEKAEHEKALAEAKAAQEEAEKAAADAKAAQEKAAGRSPENHIGRPVVSPHPQILSTGKIWDQGDSNAYADLRFFKGRWFCSLREGSTVKSSDGIVRIIASDDGALWRSVGSIQLPGFDLRDTKLCVTPDNRLMITFGAAKRQGKKTLDLNTTASFSEDGVNWSRPNAIGEPFRWIWRPAWAGSICYGIGYSIPLSEDVRLYESEDGLRFRTVVPVLHVRNFPSEAAIVFENDGRALCVMRTGDKPQNASTVLGQSNKPYLKWTWSDLGVALGGPCILRLSDNRYVVAGRLGTDGMVRTSLCWLDIENSRLNDFLTLSSNAETGYPGMALHENELWVVYHSSQGNKVALYLAKIRL